MIVNIASGIRSIGILTRLANRLPSAASWASLSMERLEVKWHARNGSINSGHLWDKNSRIWDKLRNLAKIAVRGSRWVGAHSVALCLAISGREVCRTQ